MNWNNVSLIVLGLAAFFGAFLVALWASLVIWTFRDMRARTRDAFAQLLASLMVLVLGPFGIILYFILRPRETLAEKYERSLEEEALLQDIEERQICPGCKQPIESDYVLCPICHTSLRHACVHCGRLIHPRWSICPYCAQSQKPVPGIDRAAHVTLQDLESEPALLVPQQERQEWQETPATDDQDPEQVPPELLAALQSETEDPTVNESKITHQLDAVDSDGGPDEPPEEPGPGSTPPQPEPSAAETSPGEDDADTERGTRQPLSLFGR